MSTIVEASVPAAQFALEETVRRVPDAAFEAVRVVVDGTESVMPLVWASGADGAAITAALEDDDSTDAVRVLTRLHKATLYRLEWTTRVRIVTDLLVVERGTIVSARAHDGSWTFRILFPERDAIAAIVESCDRYDVALRIDRIYPMTETPYAARTDLTDQQFRTIKTAHERGYYAVPRETTLTELSAELGVSHQALSERLRRGHRRLVEATLGSPIRLESQP